MSKVILISVWLGLFGLVLADEATTRPTTRTASQLADDMAASPALMRASLLATTSPSDPGEWTLTDIANVRSIKVTPDHRWIIVERSYRSAKSMSGSGRADFFVVNAANGKAVHLSELLPLADILAGHDPFVADDVTVNSAVISNDGQSALVKVSFPFMREKHNVVFILNMKDMTAIRLLEGSGITCLWWGNDIVSSNLEDTAKFKDQKLPFIEKYDRNGKKLGNLAVCGVLLNTSVDGKRLAVLADPANLSTPTPLSEAEKTVRTVIVDQDGKNLQKLEPARQVLLSPAGKFVAFTPMNTQKLTVANISDGTTREFNNGGRILSLDDTGIATLLVDNKNAVITINSKGEEKTILKDVRFADVCDKKIYYMTKDGDGVIMKADIPAGE